MRDRRSRRWESHEENDPLAGLVNLFDLWMVFSIAILIIFAGASRQRTPSDQVSAKSHATAPMVDRSTAQSIPQYRVSREALEGSGEKLGTAYRLASGEIVCVPDTATTPARSPSSSAPLAPAR